MKGDIVEVKMGNYNPIEGVVEEDSGDKIVVKFEEHGHMVFSKDKVTVKNN